MVYNVVGAINEGVLAVLFVIVGFLATFLGKKLFKQLIFFITFSGASLVTYFALNKIGVIPLGTNSKLLISCIFGLLIGALCVWVYQAAIFTTGFIGGIILGQGIWQLTSSLYKNYLSKPQVYNVLFAFILGLICACLLFKFVEQILKGFTAFVGSFLCTSGSVYITNKYFLNNQPNLMSMIDYFKWAKHKNFAQRCERSCYISIGIWITLFISGVFYQYKCHKKFKEKKKEKKILLENKESNLSPQIIVVEKPIYIYSDDLSSSRRQSSRELSSRQIQELSSHRKVYSTDFSNGSIKHNYVQIRN